MFIVLVEKGQTYRNIYVDRRQESKFIKIYAAILPRIKMKLRKGSPKKAAIEVPEAEIPKAREFSGIFSKIHGKYNFISWVFFGGGGSSLIHSRVNFKLKLKSKCNNLSKFYHIFVFFSKNFSFIMLYVCSLLFCIKVSICEPMRYTQISLMLCIEGQLNHEMFLNF